MGALVLDRAQGASALNIPDAGTFVEILPTLQLEALQALRLTPGRSFPPGYSSKWEIGYAAPQGYRL